MPETCIKPRCECILSATFSRRACARRCADRDARIASAGGLRARVLRCTHIHTHIHNVAALGWRRRRGKAGRLHDRLQRGHDVEELPPRLLHESLREPRAHPDFCTSSRPLTVTLSLAVVSSATSTLRSHEEVYCTVIGLSTRIFSASPREKAVWPVAAETDTMSGSGAAEAGHVSAWKWWRMPSCQTLVPFEGSVDSKGRAPGE